jgi:hypothetical protein
VLASQTSRYREVVGGKLLCSKTGGKAQMHRKAATSCFIGWMNPRIELYVVIKRKIPFLSELRP